MRRPIDTIIDPELCTGCGECVRVCPSDAITMIDDIAVVTGEESLACGHCAAVCPTEAITVPALANEPLVTVAGADGYLGADELDVAALVRLMRSRRSCRNFTTAPVSRETLGDLVRIATAAPSGTNSQRWSFAVLPTREAVLELAETIRGFFERLNQRAANPILRGISKVAAGDVLGRYHREYAERVAQAIEEWRSQGRDRLFHGAPSAMLIGSLRGASCPKEDALLASQNVLLAAHAMGLGTCLIGFAVSAIASDPSIRRLLALRRGEQIHAVIAIGHPDEGYLRPAGRRPVTPRFLERLPAR